MIETILSVIIVISLIIGSYTDIRTREVPDWVNYSVIFVGLGLRLLFSATTSNWNYLLYGIYGFTLFLLFGFLMFYTGQWGGGDTKLLMGIGALIGFELKLNSFLLIFLANVLIAGALYGLIYSFILAIRNWKQFTSKLKQHIHKYKKHKYGSWIIAVALLVGIIIINDFYIRLLLFVTMFFSILFFYLWAFTKSIEQACMYKFVSPEKLTEGDWIAKKYTIDGKYICGPKDLGIEKKQIKKLIQLKRKGKIKKIKIKEGIPFVPSFLLGYIISVMYGAWFLI